MRRSLLVAVIVLLAVLGASAAYVTVTAGRELQAIRSLLASDPGNLDRSVLVSASRRLDRAQDKLSGPPAKLLELIPVGRQNVQVVRELVERTEPVLAAAIDLERTAASAFDGGSLRGGVVELGTLRELDAALSHQRASLSALYRSLSEAPSGWLLPGVLSSVEELAERVAPLTRSADRASAALDLAPRMVGHEGSRTYLVMLINNAELRGAGGIMSAAGIMTVERGRFSLGGFDYYATLDAATPAGPTPTPADLKRRFDRYLRTGPWVNASASPDVPEVARYVAELYRRARDRTTDGAIVVDPRGLAALLSPDRAIDVEGRSGDVSAQGLARFIYSRAYELYEDQTGRRNQLVGVGRNVIDAALSDGVDMNVLDRIGEALRGEHIRIVSFDRREARQLEGLGVTGSLAEGARDRLMATVQNLGGDKLDYWTARTIRHRCEIASVALARCVTDVTIRNTAPRGLPLYVVQDKKRYASYRGYLEVYVPEDAAVTGSSSEGKAIRPFEEVEDGRTSLGAYFTVPRGGSHTTTISYDLPLDGQYDLAVAPQPLTRDARLLVKIAAPQGWQVRGPRRTESTVLTFDGLLNETVRFTAEPAPSEPGGLTGLWEDLRSFWDEPVLD